MRVFLTTEQHFVGIDGAVYSETIGHYAAWQPYLQVFDEVVVVARVHTMRTLPAGARRADGDGVCFYPLRPYTGPWQYLWAWPAVRRSAREVAKQDGAFILRAPGAIATSVWLGLRRLHKSFGVIVGGDPDESLSRRALKSVWAYLIRPLAVAQLKAQCREAACVGYVARCAIPQRYPPGGWSAFFSDVVLPDEAFIDDHALAARLAAVADPATSPRPKGIGFVGSLAQLYKAPDVLLKAMASCVRSGLDLRLTMIGEGRYKDSLKVMAASLGLADKVAFLGHLPPGQPVRDELDRCDLFVLPSLTEGLPRALIEAMARGLPCIGAAVGGVPELLAAEDLVVPGDADALARQITAVLTDPPRMARMSARNVQQARAYRSEVMLARRMEFYHRVKSAAAAESGRA